MTRIAVHNSRFAVAIILALLTTGIAVFPIFVLKQPTSLQPIEGVPIQLTSGNSNDTYPAMSPNGLFIAFSSNRQGMRTSQIWIMNSADGSHLIRLTSLTGNATSPKWSPDGLKIAFTEDTGKNYELWVVDRDGTDLRNLTGTETLPISFNWSPTGDQIVYGATLNGVPKIVITDTGDFQNKLQMDCPPANQCYDPSFSTNGDRVVFATKNDWGYGLVVWNVKNLTTNDILNLSSISTSMISCPVFSVDSNSIYFLHQGPLNNSVETDLFSNWGVYASSLISEENSSSRNILTPPPSETYAQTWQPIVSGDSLFSLKPNNYSDILLSGYSSGGTADLFLVDENSLIEEFAGGGFSLTSPGISVQRLTSLQYRAITGLTWSTDGNLIVFSAADLGSYQSHVFVMRYVELVQINPYAQ